MKKVKAPKNLDEAIEIIAALQKEITDLKELLGLNSKNSSIPPSQDKTKKKLNTNLLGVTLEGSLAIKEVPEGYFLNLR